MYLGIKMATNEVREGFFMIMIAHSCFHVYRRIVCRPTIVGDRLRSFENETSLQEKCVEKSGTTKKKKNVNKLYEGKERMILFCLLSFS